MGCACLRVRETGFGDVLIEDRVKSWTFMIELSYLKEYGILLSAD